MLDEIQPPAEGALEQESDSLGGGIGIGVGMGHGGDDGSLDQRSIRSEARTMLYMGEAVDRSLKKTHRIRTVSKIPAKMTAGARRVATSRSLGSIHLNN